MKPELSNKLIEILSGIQSSISQAKDFTVEQLPDVAQQYIIYGRVVETFLFGLPLFLFFATQILFWFLLRKVTRSVNLSVREDLLTGCIFSGLGCVIWLFFSVLAFSNFAMVWFAPKLYLLKGLASLVH